MGIISCKSCGKYIQHMDGPSMAVGPCPECKDKQKEETVLKEEEIMPKEIKNEYKTTKKGLIKAQKRIIKAQGKRIQELEAILNIDYNGEQVIDQLINASVEIPKKPEIITRKLKLVGGKIMYGDKEAMFYNTIDSFGALKTLCTNEVLRFYLGEQSYRVTPDMFEEEAPKEPEFSTDAMMENKEAEKKKETVYCVKGFHDVDEFYRDDEHRWERTDREARRVNVKDKNEAQRRIELGLDMASDGQWSGLLTRDREEAIDRIIRALTGCETIDTVHSDYRGSWHEKEFLSNDEYKKFIAEYEDGGKFKYPYTSKTDSQPIQEPDV